MERAIKLDAILHWLGRVGSQEAAEILIGLVVDNGNSAEDLTIVEIFWDAQGHARTLRLSDGTTIPLRAIVSVIDGPDGRLSVAVEAAVTPGERAARERKRQTAMKLAAHGFAGVFATEEDAEAVLALAEALRDEKPITYQSRHAAFLAISKGEQPALCRPGAALFRRLIERETAHRDIAGDNYWRLAKLLHVSGELHEAAAFDKMLWNNNVLNLTDRRLLATTVAAVQLRLASVTHDNAYLRAAHRACGLAWSLGPGDEATANIFAVVKSAMRSAGIGHEKG